MHVYIICRVIIISDDDAIVNVPAEISPSFFAWVAAFGDL